MEDMQIGIVRVSAIPVYTKASYSSQLIDQYLYGEMYDVLWRHEQYPFLYVCNHHNKSMGWILEGQHTPISKELFVEITAVDIRIVADLFAPLLLHNKQIHLSMGARLPLAGIELFSIDAIKFDGNYILASQRKSINYVIKLASSIEGVPYLRGGRTPFGLDSSGLIILLYRLMGIELAKELNELETYGKWIESFNDIEKGDLIFFADSTLKIYHVGMYLGDNQILNIDNFVKITKISEEGILSENEKFIEHKIYSIKRIIKKNI